MFVLLIMFCLLEWSIVMTQFGDYTVFYYVVPYVLTFFFITNKYKIQKYFIITLMISWMIFFTFLIIAYSVFNYMNPVFAVISIFVPLILTPIIIILYLMLNEL